MECLFNWIPLHMQHPTTRGQMDKLVVCLASLKVNYLFLGVGKPGGAVSVNRSWCFTYRETETQEGSELNTRFLHV